MFALNVFFRNTNKIDIDLIHSMKQSFPLSNFVFFIHLWIYFLKLCFPLTFFWRKRKLFPYSAISSIRFHTKNRKECCETRNTIFGRIFVSCKRSKAGEVRCFILLLFMILFFFLFFIHLNMYDAGERVTLFHFTLNRISCCFNKRTISPLWYYLHIYIYIHFIFTVWWMVIQAVNCIFVSFQRKNSNGFFVEQK